jgi:hypothetical protein
MFLLLLNWVMGAVIILLWRVRCLGEIEFSATLHQTNRCRRGYRFGRSLMICAEEELIAHQVFGKALLPLDNG